MVDNKMQARGFLVWGICALFFLYEFFLRTVLGTYQHQVMFDLDINTFEFSLLSTTTFLLIYGGMQIPVGLIANKFGLKKSLMCASLCCAIAAIGLASAHTYVLALFYRTLMGLGASFGFVCVLLSVHDWMPHKYSAIFIGLSQFIGTMGPMIAAGPLESLSSSDAAIGWRSIFVVLSLVGLVLMGLTWLFVENNVRKSGEYKILHRPEKALSAMRGLFSAVQPWSIAVVSACLYFSIEYLSENEGRSFLDLKGIAASHAGYIITTAWIGYAIGCPLLGVISDFFERRKKLLDICAILSVAAVIMVLYASNEKLLLFAFFLLGVGAGGQSIGFAIIAEQFKKQFVAVGFGLNNAVITIFSAINAPIIGFLLDYSRHGQSLSLANYLSVFNILIVIVLVALVVSGLCIKETYGKSAVDFTILTVR